MNGCFGGSPEMFTLEPLNCPVGGANFPKKECYEKIHL